ncbi:hypothetical protein [Paenibacillus sp. 453mf]|uniref:hypothetical protein n=1 Tax=Paenibacillus sp. 453mf TaxID=1761874 RepID=UPI0008EEB8B6|nr:hypothetical protein [Paenibacillus sp. 453mf]SFS42291.1 hypothetical protein SAMN04488601_101522 [Paenibacillus sp. 453mf]
MKKRSIITLILSVVVLLSCTNYSEVKAAEETVSPIIVKRNLTSLELNWNVDGDIFEIIDSEGNTLYHGDQKNYTINNLEPNSIISFDLVVYDEGNIVSSQQIITSTLENSVNLRSMQSSTDIDTSLTSISSNSGVNLTWNEIPGVEEYRVYRDQKLLATTNENFYTDETISSNSLYTYEIEFSAPLSEIEKQEVEKFFSENEDLNLSEAEIDQMSSSRPVSIIRVVDTTTSNPIQSRAASTTSFSWIYKTFLPMDYIEDPIPGNGIAFFGGDNRTFSFDSEKYRTKMWGKTIFEPYNSEHNFSKNVHATTAYDDNKNYISSKTASDELMYGVKNTHTYTKADYTYYHKVGNPYIPVSGQEIDIQMRVITNSNGTYSFEGVHDRAPSHELYLTLNNGASNRMIFAHPNEGLSYLGAPSTLARWFTITGSL